ncbi:hypothetical protein [Thiolapillus sp.]|uniref:hypothetical protein n=1 Tax=Thiolapillus sp. TaxID=2017437 RepID=UPI003AF452B1
MEKRNLSKRINQRRKKSTAKTEKNDWNTRTGKTLITTEHNKQHIEVKMDKENQIIKEINDLAQKIGNLLNKENIESELGHVLTYILEEADKHLMDYLENQP